MAAPENSRYDASPPYRHVLITPSDTVDLDPRPRALYTVDGGVLNLEDDDGVSLPYTVGAEKALSFSPTKVLASGTTATTIYAWY